MKKDEASFSRVKYDLILKRRGSFKPHVFQLYHQQVAPGLGLKFSHDPQATPTIYFFHPDYILIDTTNLLLTFDTVNRVFPEF